MTLLTYNSTFNELLSHRPAREYDDLHDRRRWQLDERIAPDGATQQYTYNSLGELVEWTNALGQAATYAYNANGQVTYISLPDTTSDAYTYDSRGNLLTAAGSGGTWSFDYNSLDMPTQVTEPNGTVSITYNVVGQPTQMSDQTGFTENYGYDAVGRLQEITDGQGNMIESYSYDLAGNLIGETKGNGTSTSYQYNADGELIQLTNLAPGGTTVNSSFTYAYNALGLITSMTTGGATTLYAYDADSELTSVTAPGESIQYAYDAAGNFTSITDNGVVTAYTANSVNEYTTVGSTSYTYDADGNMTSSTSGGVTTTYTFNSQNELAAVNGPTGNYSYTYDALGNRISSTTNGTTTTNLIDPLSSGTILAQFNGSQVLAHYTYGLGLVSQVSATGSSAYYDFNQLGSTVGITNAAGQYVNQYTYSPFGQTTTVSAALSNPFTYIGQAGVVNDGSGLLDMRARTYDPSTGQFISTDPIGIASGSTNLTRYVNNDPVKESDPAGFCAHCPEALLLTGLAAQAGVANGLFLIGAFGFALYVGWNCSDYAKKIWDESQQYPLDAWGFGPREAYAGGGSTVGDPKGASGGASEPCCTPPPPPAAPAARSKPVASGSTKVVVSADPNDITGPAGIGSAGFISSESTLPYTIDFENLPTATAPAQTVTVTQQLSPNLDWSTFQLGAIDFGSTVVNVPAGRTSYTTTIDATATLGLFVDVTAGINLSTGLVTWTFTSIDPATLDLTSNPLAGFLPPDETPPEGEGSVSYTIKPKANLASGTVVSAQATVVFDTNAPINTPTLDNTLDITPPTSSVNPLPSTTTSTSFTVSWSGSDPTGPGIADYNVFVSDDGGPFTLWQSGTSATSAIDTGQVGHTYAFFSVATDNLGLVQTTPSAAQASISLVLPPVVIVPPPVVIAKIQIFENRKHLVTQIVVTFSGALNAAEAATTAPFHLATPGKRGSFTAKNAGTIKLKSAAYNPAADKVTLTPRKAFALSKPVQLKVYAELPFGLEDSLGRFINGGTDALAVLTKREVTKGAAAVPAPR